LNFDGVPTPEGASGSIVPSSERPFPWLTTHNQFRKGSFGCGENSHGAGLERPQHPPMHPSNRTRCGLGRLNGSAFL
jgi:hypothetical protein